MTLRGIPTKLSNRWVFLDADASPERVWTLLVLPADSHQPALTVKSTRRHATHPKPNSVVEVIARIVVAIGRSAIRRIVVPGTAAQQLGCSPQLEYRGWEGKGEKEGEVCFNGLGNRERKLPSKITPQSATSCNGWSSDRDLESPDSSDDISRIKG